MNATRWTAPGKGTTVKNLITAMALSIQAEAEKIPDHLIRRTMDHLDQANENAATNLSLDMERAMRLTLYDFERIANCFFFNPANTVPEYRPCKKCGKPHAGFSGVGGRDLCPACAKVAFQEPYDMSERQADEFRREEIEIKEAKSGRKY